MSNEELQLRKVEAYARERDRFRTLYGQVMSCVQHGDKERAKLLITDYALMVTQEYTHQFDAGCFNYYVITKLIKSLTNSLIGDKK